jgi:hypothetical protein
VVWHASSSVEQLSRHDELALELLVAVAAPVGAVPGTVQDAWQLACCELQLIMQFVVVEVCARRIFAPAETPSADPRIASAANKTANLRMCASTGA